MKTCLIGCGGMVEWAHGPSYLQYQKEYPDMEFSACCDIDLVKAQQVQKKFGFKRCYTNYIEMLNHEKPDAVCLVSPEHLTMEISIAVMEMGYNILLEKPPGLDVEQTTKMMEVANRNGVINQVAFNRRYMSLVTQLKNLIKDDILYNVHCDFYRVSRTENHFYTTAIHCIDTVKYLVNSDFQKVHFQYQELRELGDSVANIYLNCKFANGTISTLNINPDVGVNLERITVNCLNNTYVLELPLGPQGFGRLIGYHMNEKVMDIVSEVSEAYIINGFYNENADFFNNVRNKTYSKNDIRSGLQSVECAHCIKLRKKIYIP